MKRLLILILSLAVICSVLLSSCSSSSSTTPTTTTPVSNETIKLGITLPLSGAFAASAPYQTGVITMITDEINAAGGLLGGRKIEIIQRDNQNDPSLLPQTMNQLKQAGCVSIFVIIAGPDASVFPWATQNKIPVYGASGDNVQRTKDFSKYGFYTGYMDLALSQVIAKSLADSKDIKNIYLLSGDIFFAHETWDALWPILNKIRPDIQRLGETYVGNAESDFSATVNTIIAKKPDYLFTFLGGPTLVTFMQQAKQFDLASQVNIAGGMLLGSQSSSPFGADYPVEMKSFDYFPFWLDTPEMKDFTAKHLAKFNIYPDNLSAYGLNWITSITEAIKKTNSTDADKLVAALEGMTYNTVLGQIKIDSWDHQFEMPIYYSTTSYSPNFPIAVGKNTVKYQDGLYPDAATIQAMKNAP